MSEKEFHQVTVGSYQIPGPLKIGAPQSAGSPVGGREISFKHLAPLHKPPRVEKGQRWRYVLNGHTVNEIVVDMAGDGKAVSRDGQWFLMSFAKVDDWHFLGYAKPDKIEVGQRWKTPTREYTVARDCGYGQWALAGNDDCEYRFNERLLLMGEAACWWEYLGMASTDESDPVMQRMLSAPMAAEPMGAEGQRELKKFSEPLVPWFEFRREVVPKGDGFGIRANIHHTTMSVGGAAIAFDPRVVVQQMKSGGAHADFAGWPNITDLYKTRPITRELLNESLNAAATAFYGNEAHILRAQPLPQSKQYAVGLDVATNPDRTVIFKTRNVANAAAPVTYEHIKSAPYREGHPVLDAKTENRRANELAAKRLIENPPEWAYPRAWTCAVLAAVEGDWMNVDGSLTYFDDAFTRTLNEYHTRRSLRGETHDGLVRALTERLGWGPPRELARLAMEAYAGGMEKPTGLMARPKPHYGSTHAGVVRVER